MSGAGEIGSAGVGSDLITIAAAACDGFTGDCRTVVEEITLTKTGPSTSVCRFSGDALNRRGVVLGGGGFGASVCGSGAAVVASAEGLPSDDNVGDSSFTASATVSCTGISGTLGTDEIVGAIKLALDSLAACFASTVTERGGVGNCD